MAAPQPPSVKTTEDVEMKEVLEAPSNSVPSSVPSVLHHLKEIASLIEMGTYAKEVRRIMRAVRLTIALRRKLNAPTLSTFLSFALIPGSDAHSKLSSYLPKVKYCETLGFRLHRLVDVACATDVEGRSGLQDMGGVKWLWTLWDVMLKKRFAAVYPNMSVHRIRLDFSHKI